MTRRRFLAAGAGGLMAMGGVAGLPASSAAWSPRRPGDVPDRHRPPGTPDPRIPIDHVVVVMMENHSFDNYLGMLPRSGRSGADGFRFDQFGRPRDANPVAGGGVRTFPMPGEGQTGAGPNQAWDATHPAGARRATT